MPQGIRRPHEAIDYDALTRMYPPPPEYFESTWLEDRERIEAKQLARLKDRALRAYRVPFFQRRWDAAGFDPRSIDSLDDLNRIPFYTVDDIRKSIEAILPSATIRASIPATPIASRCACSCRAGRPERRGRRCTRPGTAWPARS